MDENTMYAVVDYHVDIKANVASVFYGASLSANMALCKSYTEAREAAEDFLVDGSDEVAIIPIKLDVDNTERVYSEMIVKTVKLKK